MSTAVTLGMLVTCSLTACSASEPARQRLRGASGPLARPVLASRAATRYGARVGAVLSSTLKLLARPPRAGRLHYYAHGVFHTRVFDCWRCDVEPGLVAADLAYEFPLRPSYRTLAISTFDAMLHAHTYPNGSFGPPLGGEAGNGISTMSVINELGVAYLVLRPWLDPATATRWVGALRRAGKWLEPTLDFYVNGNINLGETLSMYLVYRATGDTGFLAAYNRAFDFTMRPRGARWRGFGLHFLRPAHRRDDSDGAGYLAEQGAGAPGFDPHYTIVQSGVAATLYEVSHKPRALRLLNLLTNTLLLRTNPGTDLIVTTGGSRRPAPSVGYLESPALAVLAFAGHRASLMPLVRVQLNEIAVSFHNYAVRATDQNGGIAEFANELLELPQFG